MLDALRHQLSLLLYSWRTLGPGTMVRNALRWSLDEDARNPDSNFDARFGTDTASTLTPGEARLPAEARAVATMYLPSRDEDLDIMLGALAWSETRLREATFVDVGSGKARIVLVAAMRRFQQVVGLELSPVLHAIAERNLELVRATGALVSPVRLALGDALELDVPRGPLVVYLYHPFRATVAASVVARLVEEIAARPRPAAILYGHPTLQRPYSPEVFARGDMFTEHARGERRTRQFRIGWSVWTNEAWLARGRRVAAGA